MFIGPLILGMVDGQDEGADVAPKDSEAVEIGRRIATLREAKGLTQDDLTYALGLGAGTVSRWERGARWPHASQLKKLRDFFGVSIDHIVAGDEPVPFEETAEWFAFLETPYGKLARERGWLEEIKRTAPKLGVPLTSKVFENLAHTMLSGQPA